MTVSVRRLFVTALALGTVALSACAGDPVSPNAKSPTKANLETVYNGSGN